jgi:hypothetical protein
MHTHNCTKITKVFWHCAGFLEGRRFHNSGYLQVPSFILL